MKLQSYRIKNGIPAETICTELGIARSTLSRYETGERFPNPRVMKKIIEMTKGKVSYKDYLKAI